MIQLQLSDPINLEEYLYFQEKEEKVKKGATRGQSWLDTTGMPRRLPTLTVPPIGKLRI